jgi:zinc transporter ZupT
MPQVDSFLAVLALAVLHILCGEWRLIHSVHHSNWLSFSGGVAVAYVFESLLPKLGEWQALVAGQSQKTIAVPKFLEDYGVIAWYGGLTKFLHYEIFLLALTGVVFFFWVDWLIHARMGKNHEPGAPHQAPAGLFWLHTGLFGLYNALIGYVTAHNHLPGRYTLLLLTLALGLHFLGMNHTLWLHYRDRFDDRGRWIFAVSLFAGWALGVMTEFAQAIYIGMYSFLAGAIIVSVFNDELPNRHEAKFWPFFLGVLIYTTLFMSIYAGS